MGKLNNVKKTYTSTEWDDRETYYVQELSTLELPLDISSTQIKGLESLIDSLFCELGLEYAYCKRKSEALERTKKLMEKELFLIIKQSGISGLKSIDEINGAVIIGMKNVTASDALSGKTMNTLLILKSISDSLTATIVSNNTTPGTISPPVVTKTVPTKKLTTLMQSVFIYQDRMVFLEQLIDMLREKKGALITAIGAIKSESRLLPPEGV